MLKKKGNRKKMSKQIQSNPAKCERKKEKRKVEQKKEMERRKRR